MCNAMEVGQSKEKKERRMSVCVDDIYIVWFFPSSQRNKNTRVHIF